MNNVKVKKKLARTNTLALNTTLNQWYEVTWDAPADVGLSPGNLHQYPVRKKNVLTCYEPWNKTPSSITKQFCPIKLKTIIN